MLDLQEQSQAKALSASQQSEGFFDTFFFLSLAEQAQ
jgi:hypothetical protein